MGYHKAVIVKGVLGEASKIREELDELDDAIAQGNRILAMCEMADIYGALELVTQKYGLQMDDLRTMSRATAEAFRDGSRVVSNLTQGTWEWALEQQRLGRVMQYAVPPYLEDWYAGDPSQIGDPETSLIDRVWRLSPEKTETW